MASETIDNNQQINNSRNQERGSFVHGTDGVDSSRGSYAHGTTGGDSERGRYAHGTNTEAQRSQSTPTRGTTQRLEPREQLNQIEVNWMLVAMIAVSADFLKYVLSLIPYVGWVLSGLTNICAGIVLWLLLKNGKVQSPMKDIRASYIVAAIPLINLFQSWSYRMYKLRKKYNAENDKNAASEEQTQVGERLQIQRARQLAYANS